MTKWIKPEETHLSNGIPVVFQDWEGAVGSLYWWIQAGSADEGKGQEGFAHFLEHMLFKDAAAKETGVPSTGQTALAIESLGGDINAYTSFDQTVYHVTCAEQHLERIVDLFGTMAKPQKFLKSDFDREREVILEELRKNEDSPGRQIFQSLFTEVFKKHPYGRPVIGYTRTLKAATVAKLEAFYRAHYVSSRMGLIVVGPLGGEESPRKKKILQLLEKRFGGKVIPKKETIFKSRVVEPELRKKSDWVMRSFDVKSPTVALGFRVPDLQHADVPALDVLAGVLASGETSRLYQELFYKRSIVTDVGGSLYVPKDPGLLYFEAETDDWSKIQAATEALFTEIARIREVGPTEAELARVITHAESERLYATQTADGMAGRLGFLKFVLGDLRFDREYLEDIKAVSAEEVIQVARKYLDERRLAVAVMVPKKLPGKENEKESALTAKESKAVLSELQSIATAALKPIPEPKVTKKAVTHSVLEPQLITRPSGLRVVYLPRKQSHVFSAHASVLGGLRLEIAHPIEDAEKDWGASYLLAQTWTKGTKNLDSRAISTRVEGKAASLDGFSGRHTIGLQATGLAKDWENLSELFTEVLFQPTFIPEELEHSRRVTEDTIKSIEDHSSQLCSKLFLETLFEKHPYGRLNYGSLKSIAGMSSEKLKQLHRKWVVPSRMVLSVAGAVDSNQLENWISALEKSATAASQSATSLDVPDEQGLKAPRWVEKTLGREQIHLIVGGLGIRQTDPERYVLRILQNILGGQSGRLFIELREKKSLAYTVSPLAFEGMERGYVGTYIACSPSKKDEAITGIQKVLEKLAQKGPTPAELKRAKEFYLGHRAMDLQGDSSLAAHHGLETLYGRPLSEVREVEKLISAVSAQQIRGFCQKYFLDLPMVTSSVG